MGSAVVIGAGPAGLMAADMLSAAGHTVLVAEAKPSAARKFLMAGKSGLNLTKDEPFETFIQAYAEATPSLRHMLEAFPPDAVVRWAEDLGQEVFVGSSGRVFPKVMKASPLVRSWLAKLISQGVEFRTRWSWKGGFVEPSFETPDGLVMLRPDALVLACGGGSWARLGATGEWAKYFRESELAPFQPANMGFLVDWTHHMRPFFGEPVKNVTLKAGASVSRGEFVISRRGVEGGGIYGVSRALREGAALTLDVLPDLSAEQIRDKIASSNPKRSMANKLRKILSDPVKRALVMECARPVPPDPAEILKNLPLDLVGPYPIDEAISTAGGIRLDALDETLMLRSTPGVFAAGEMLDWEAPTGGYLLTAALATGKWAGEHAADYLANSGSLS